MNKLADIEFGPLRGFGDLGLEGSTLLATDSLTTLSRVLSIVVGLLSIVAVVWFVIKILIGGLDIMSAGGDKGKVAEARTSITNGLIGLTIVLLATVIVGFIGTIFGLNILNVSSLITSLRIN